MPTPNSKWEIPEQARFFAKLENEHIRFDTELRSGWLSTIDPDYKDELQSELVKQPSLTVYFKHDQLPVQLGGADTVRLSTLTSVQALGGGIGPFACLAVSLEADSSPFMFDEDVEEPDSVKQYDVVAGAEFPPFIMNSSYFLDDSAHYTPTIAEYLQLLRSDRREPRFLSNQACGSILNALSDANIDLFDSALSELGAPLSDHFDFDEN